MSAADFDRFWAVLPHRLKDPRSPARLVYDRLVPRSVSAAEMQAAAERYAAAERARKPDPQFLPQTRKWLAQHYWRDYLVPVEGPSTEVRGAVDRGPLWPPLASRMAPDLYDAWIGKCEAVIEDQRIVLRAPTRFIADRIRLDHADLVAAAWARPVVVTVGAVTVGG